eukprot:1086278-Rhodomonas_salina.3
MRVPGHRIGTAELESALVEHPKCSVRAPASGSAASVYGSTVSVYGRTSSISGSVVFIYWYGGIFCVYGRALLFSFRGMVVSVHDSTSVCCPVLTLQMGVPGGGCRGLPAPYQGT